MAEPAHPATDDASIIARSPTAPAEFAAIFDRHAPHIHRYLARRVGPQHADDLLGETPRSAGANATTAPGRSPAQVRAALATALEETSPG